MRAAIIYYDAAGAVAYVASLLISVDLLDLDNAVHGQWIDGTAASAQAFWGNDVAQFRDYAAKP